MQQIQTACYAAARIQADGSVVGAFAAILADGSVVTWGDQWGDSSAVQDQLRGVQQIQATAGAFSAILADGSVVTWGDREFGGDSSAFQDQLRGVQQIQATGYSDLASRNVVGSSAVAGLQLAGAKEVIEVCDFERAPRRWLNKNELKNNQKKDKKEKNCMIAKSNVDFGQKEKMARWQKKKTRSILLVAGCCLIFFGSFACSLCCAVGLVPRLLLLMPLLALCRTLLVTRLQLIYGPFVLAPWSQLNLA